MSNILNVRNVHDYNAWVGQTDEHPFVSVIDYREISPFRHSLNNYSVYGLFLMEDTSLDLIYGCGRYDYGETTLICVAPGQIGGKEYNGQTISMDGWALLFHPDLLHGTFLEKKLTQYSFFSYNVNEALHMTPSERDILVSYFKMIKQELHSPNDTYRDSIIVNLTDCVLQYCMRFYNRQFSTRRPQNSDILTRFELALHQYFDTKRQLTDGLPTVQFFASELFLSGNYFADLIKKQTGLTASEHIRRFIIERAKSLLMSGESINRAAYELGFEYPQHFSRMFKKTEGLTPSDYVAKRKAGQ